MWETHHSKPHPFQTAQDIEPQKKKKKMNSVGDITANSTYVFKTTNRLTSSMYSVWNERPIRFQHDRNFKFKISKWLTVVSPQTNSTALLQCDVGLHIGVVSCEVWGVLRQRDITMELEFLRELISQVLRLKKNILQIHDNDCNRSRKDSFEILNTNFAIFD